MYIPTDTDCSELIPGMCGGKMEPTMLDNCDSMHFEGVENVDINQGVGIDLADGVKAYDSTGLEIPFEYEPTEIDKCSVGEHEVIYKAISADERLLPSICGDNFLSMACSGIGTLIAKRLVTIEQADPPTINGIDAATLSVDEPFDPMNGVTGVDDNGNPVDVTYSGKLADSAEGDIASFETDLTDPLRSLKVSLDPIQDLHGYDSPWVGGAGANKIPYPYSNTPVPSGVTVTDNGDGTLTVNGTAPSTTYYYMFGNSNTEVPSWVKPNTQYCAGNIPSVTDFYVQFILYGKNGATTIVTETTAKTTPADFTNYRCAIVVRIVAGTYNNVLIKPLLFEGVSLPNSWTSWENICPIYGHDSVGANVSGVNVWDEEWRNGYYDATTGIFAPYNSQIANTNPISVKPNTSYAIVPRGTTIRFVYLDANKDVISVSNASNSITTPSNCYYINFNMFTAYGGTYKNDISINYPSTDTAYHAYEGDTYTANLSQTVYGGWVDLVKGAADSKDTHALVTYDGTENWGKDSDISSGAIHRFYLRNDDIKKYTDYSDKLLCNKCLATNNYSYAPSIGDFAVTAYSITSNNDNYVYILSKTIDTVEGIKAWLAEEPLQLWYPKATPTGINIQGQTITTLYGRNNVWSEQGDVYVEFWKSIPQGEFSYPLDGVYTIDYHAEDECGNVNDSTRAIIVGDVGMRTVLYEDGTLIINESPYDIVENTTKHGEATKVYEPLNAAGTNYVWTSEPNVLWHESSAVANSIKRVEIGSPIRPTSIAYWFYILRECKEIDLTNLDTSRCTNMERAFSYVGYMVSDGDAVPYLDLSMFDTSNVTNMRYMFNHIYGAKVIDVSSWVVSPTVDTHFIFSYCDLTETIYASPSFQSPTEVDYGYFMGCSRLVGGAGTAYANMGYENSYSKYAKIDNPPDEPGYFTAKD